MNRKTFFDVLRSSFGSLIVSQVAGFSLILDEAVKRGTKLDRLAYILATTWWETANTMQPVAEGYWMKNAEAWRKKNLRYYPFYGRGYVQLTWEFNYKKASKYFGVDFVKNPDLVMDPKYAIPILFVGMEEGWFTGKSMTDFLDGVDEDDAEDLREFSNARTIINGKDRQVEIGKIALKFERALRRSDYGTTSVTPEPTPAPQEAPVVTPDAPAQIDAAPVVPARKDSLLIRILRVIVPFLRKLLQ